MLIQCVLGLCTRNSMMSYLRLGSFVFSGKTALTVLLCSPVKLSSNEEQKSYVVTLHGEDFMSCQCGLYEHLGMLCRRALKVQ